MDPMIAKPLAALGKSRAQPQTGTPINRNLAPLAAPFGACFRLGVLAAALLGSGAIAQAQLLSLKIDSAARTYSWTGSQFFRFETGLDSSTVVGLGFNFETINTRDTELPTQSAASGLFARGDNLFSLGGAGPRLLRGDASFADIFNSLSVGPQTVVQLFGWFTADLYLDGVGNDSWASTTYEVVVDGGGGDFSLPFNAAADLSNLDGKRLQLIRFDYSGDGMATGFLDAGTISVTPVPEPASVAFASAVGLVGFAVWRRRNQAKRALSQDAAS